MTFIVGTPHTHNSGYFRNDDRPGGGKLSEADIQTCSHCQAVIKLQEWKEDGGFCRGCMKPVCAFCGDRMLLYGCEPYVKKLEQALGLADKYTQYVKISGLEPTSPPPQIFIG